MSEKKRPSKGLVIFGLILFLLGTVAAVVFFLKSGLLAKYNSIIKYSALCVGVLGIVVMIIGFLKKSSSDNEQEDVSPEPLAEVQVNLFDDQPQDPVRYIPSENVYQFVNMGDRQSIEEKFNQISRMDKTQFVIYIARLFSRKGYQVKFTPVVDNFDIDLLVEKMGVTIAVGCILTNKVLCESDIRCVAEGRSRYQASNVMTLTNMYFDRTALEFAKRERMSLVDRNILAEDFML